ncbi:MAG: pilin [Methylotenera sp.]|nr:pilin [Methylotenera sp.]
MKARLSRLLGFSVIEMMVVVAIIAILAMIAIPSSMHRIVREQVLAAIPLADIAKEPINYAWTSLKTLPVDNLQANLPVPEKVVSNFISSLEVQNGAIHMIFGNKAHPQLQGKILSIRPAVIEESQRVPITWVCGNAKAPKNMIIKGINRTNVSIDYLPSICK